MTEKYIDHLNGIQIFLNTLIEIVIKKSDVEIYRVDHYIIIFEIIISKIFESQNFSNTVPSP